MTTAEGAEEEPDESNYKPSKEIYDWIFNDAKTGVPEIVEDEDTMYVIVRKTEDIKWKTQLMK